MPAGRRRAAAIGSLLGWAAITLLLITFGIRNIASLGVGLVGALAIIAGAWRAIVHRGMAQLVGVGVAVIGVGLLITSIVMGVDGRGEGTVRFLEVGALIAVSLILGRYALRREIRLAADDPTWSLVPRPRHPVLICNPKSGGGKAVEADLEARATAMGVETIVMDGASDLRALAEAAVASGADCLGMAGGDGSQAIVAEVAMAHDLPYVCIPAGTRNHLALDLTLDRNDPAGALTSFTSGVERRIDVAYVAEGDGNEHLFLNNVSLGVYGEMVRDPNYRDDKLGTALTHLGELTAAGTDPYDLRFVGPLMAEVEGALVIQVSNNPYELSRLSDFGQRLRLDTGTLGVVAIRGDRFVDPAPIVALAAAGQLGLSPAVVAWSTPDFTVESDDDVLWAGVDGETVELRPPLAFRVRPLALRVHVPLDNLKAAEDRRSRDVRFRRLITVALGHESD